MPDTAVAPVAELPTPTSSSSVGSLRFLASWFRGFGRFAGWLVIPLVPIWIFSTIAIYELMAYDCYFGGDDFSSRFERGNYDVGCVQRTSFTMAGVSLLLVFAACLFIGSALATLKQPKSGLAPAAVATRLQGLKDWFIRGDIDEAEYQNLRSLIESGSDEKSLAVTARRGTTLMRSTAFLLVPGAVFWFISTGIFIDEIGYYDDEVSYILSWTVGGLLFVVAFVLLLLRASQLGRFADDFAKDLGQRIDAAEEQVMRSARGRAGPVAQVATGGASFRAYSARRKS